jgi:F0F1-type ATP synthase assembly protein I
MEWNWFESPMHYICPEIIDKLISGLLLGLWLGWYMGRTPKAA